LSPKSKSERLLDGLLAGPEWYAAILLAQLPAREIPPLLKQTWERNDKALREWVKGHSVEEVPELLRGFLESRLSLLESELHNELERRIDWLSFRGWLRIYRLYSRYLADSLKLIRNADRFFKPKEETSRAKAIHPKATGRSVARPPHRSRPRSPRSSAQQMGSHGGVQKVRPLKPKKKTTKQSQEPPHGSAPY
jgi:hypothetical protein